MGEFNYAKGRINESIQFITKEMLDFDKEYSGKSWQEYQQDTKLQKLMERTIENILTALVEVCGTLVAERGISAENYSGVLKEASKMFGFGPAEQEELAKLAVQRNRLAHRYLDFKWQAIQTYIEQRKLVEKLLAAILAKEGRTT